MKLLDKVKLMSHELQGDSNLLPYNNPLISSKKIDATFSKCQAVIGQQIL